MNKPEKINRRHFMGAGVQIASVVALSPAAISLSGCSDKEEGAMLENPVTTNEMVWQIDPDKCTSCGKCATTCVLNTSASKALNCFDLCGYCDICTGYFTESYFDLDTGAENHMCPTNALRRTFIERKSGQRFYEYTIDKDLCIGCAKCVKGCALMNGSLYMQINQHECVRCNECSIALQCPARAFYRIPASQQEIFKVAAVGLLEGRGKKLVASDDPAKQRAGERLLSRCKVQRQWRKEQAALEAVDIETLAGEGADA